MKKLLSCAFNMDSGCVELKFTITWRFAERLEYDVPRNGCGNAESI